MTRTNTALSAMDKGKQSTRQSPVTTDSSGFMEVNADANAQQSAARPTTLSPDAARGDNTTAKTSRFLRKSRSKQHLRDDSEQSHSSGLLHTSSANGQQAGTNQGQSQSSANACTPPLASPVRQTVRRSGFTSPLSSGSSGNKQAAASATDANANGSQQQQQRPVASNGDNGGRSVGAWFSTMLSASQNQNQSSNNDNNDTASIRSFATVASSPSRFLQRKSGLDSPQRRSTLHASYNGTEGLRQSTGNAPSGRSAPGRLAGFDRMFDRAIQFFTDSDSNADKCPDDIWLLGVRHDGWRPEQEQQPVPSPLANSTSTSKRPSIDTINSESYFQVADSSNLPKPPPSRQLVSSGGRRRLSKSSNRTVSSNDASSPSSLELPSSPPRQRAAGLFNLKARKAATLDSRPTSQLLERTVSTSSSSSTGKSDNSFPRNSAAADDGLPDSASIYTFSEEPANSGSPSTPLPLTISSAQTLGWPPAFYYDFYSRIQLTYRSGFHPLPSAPAAPSANLVTNAFSNMFNNLNASLGRSATVSNLGDVQAPSGLTTDSGWGCMLRTGQSLLANALMDVHLGRDFRRPLPQSSVSPTSPTFFSSTPLYSKYVRLASWFFDDPSTLSPFSIHKFAVEGKKLGKQIGEWFGPSTAAGAIKVLANDYAPANLGVALAIDTTVYGSEVFHVARGDNVQGWNRPVLILVPLRLGLNGVNPIYHNSIQHYFTLPQCVGIAGGRPSSSYYFVGAQGNQLFYMDPHHTKPSVKAVSVPAHLQEPAQSTPLSSVVANDNPSKQASNELDDLSAFFANAYGPKELESFHCEKVRKMSLSALDPSMLVGLLCQSKEDWEDLCSRMKEFPMSKDHHPIINIVQEMPAWMRKPSRTISGAGLNASTLSAKAMKASTSTSSSSARNGEGTAKSGGIKNSPDTGDDLVEGSSVDYADSDDWDIDESDAEDEQSDTEKSEAEELGNESIVINDTSSFQDVLQPSSLEPDEPDYAAARRNARSPPASTSTSSAKAKGVSLPSSTSESPSPAAPLEEFEKIRMKAAESISTSPLDSASESMETDVIVVSPPRETPSTIRIVNPRRDTSIEAEDKQAGWETFAARSPA